MQLLDGAAVVHDTIDHDARARLAGVTRCRAAQASARALDPQHQPTRVADGIGLVAEAHVGDDDARWRRAGGAVEQSAVGRVRRLAREDVGRGREQYLDPDVLPTRAPELGAELLECVARREAVARGVGRLAQVAVAPEQERRPAEPLRARPLHRVREADAHPSAGDERRSRGVLAGAGEACEAHDA